jgi:hypothetical protein
MYQSDGYDSNRSRILAQRSIARDRGESRAGTIIPPGTSWRFSLFSVFFFFFFFFAADLAPFKLDFHRS